MRKKMSNVLERIYEGILCFLLLSIQWAVTYCAEDSDQIVNLQKNDFSSSVPRAKLGEFCWVGICQENQFCNEEFFCQCLPGFKIYNNECISRAEENEPCIKSEDCCRELFCINGVCRKVVSNSEFITLAKICLGITVTTIIVAVFCSLVKCLYRHDNFRAFQGDNSSLNSILPFRRQAPDPGPLQCEVLDEKPPSYEECIRSTVGNLPVEPPPYIISTDATVISTTESRSCFTVPNMSNVSPQNLTPLSAENLNHDVKSNAIGTESSEKERPHTSVNSPS